MGVIVDVSIDAGDRVDIGGKLGVDADVGTGMSSDVDLGKDFNVGVREDTVAGPEVCFGIGVVVEQGLNDDVGVDEGFREDPSGSFGVCLDASVCECGAAQKRRNGKIRTAIVTAMRQKLLGNSYSDYLYELRKKY